MSRTVFIDWETASPVDLRRTGVEKYAEHPSTMALCLAWAFDDGPVDGYMLAGTGFVMGAPAEVHEHVAAGGAVVAHNAPFELAIWNMLHLRNPALWPALKPEQTFCTMAMCRAMGLPGALGDAAKALRLRVEKDEEGHKLMLKLCKPRRPRRGEDPTALIWDHHTPEALARLLEYCKRDIEPERAIWNLLPKLSPREREYWIIDRRINDRGVMIDLDGAYAAAEACDADKERLNAELSDLTYGSVPTASSVAKLLTWLGANGSGPDLPDMRKGTIESALKTENNATVRRVLQIRQEASKSSTAKLDAAINGACADHRMRGLIEYHGAGTGRAAGRRFQPQNMMRPPKKFTPTDAAEVIDWLKVPGGDAVVRSQYGSVISAVAYAMRSFLIAAPGKTFVAADYSNIEGRVLAWLAGEEWKLRAFRDFDAGTGHDLYKLAYAKSFGVAPESVTDDQRQIGKVQELALGYQGAHGAFVSMAKNYGIDFDAIAHAVKAIVPLPVWDDATERYYAGAYETAEEIIAARKLEANLDPLDTEPDFFDLANAIARKNRYDLPADVWCAIHIIVDGWRAAHPATVTFWRAIEAAAMEAVEKPGTITNAGRISFGKTGDFLMCRLPSGRKISYPYARVELTPSKWRPDKLDKKLVFEGVDSKTRRWAREYAYGGLLAENCIGEGALVFTRRGPIPIERIGHSDEIWDGVEFVDHGGLISKGKQETIKLDGVLMTPDHEVMTNAGWKDASSCGGLKRPEVWLPLGYDLRRLGWPQVEMARSLRLRKRKDFSCFRITEGPDAFVRLPLARNDCEKSHNARHESAPGVRGLAFDARSVLQSESRILAQLRRPWRFRLSGLAEQLRSLLARYGANVLLWLDVGSIERKRQLRAVELCVANHESSRQEQARQQNHTDAVGTCDGGGGVGALRRKVEYDPVPYRAWMGRTRFAIAPGRKEQVYDIRNCGPRSRFVVLGTSGPFIVHNCTQAVARDVLVDAQFRLEAAGFPVVLHVHDENVCEVSPRAGLADDMRRLMVTSEAWADGLPVTVSEPWTGPYYRKA